MRIIYLDSEYMCHTNNDGTMRSVETDVLDNYCDNALELVRFVPQDETWERPDGRIIHGIFVQETDGSKVFAYQRQYEEDQAQMKDMAQALAILGVTE